MIRDGFWMNYATLEWEMITEHETWIREKSNAERIGVPPEVYEHFREYVPHDDRVPFLSWLLDMTPLIRIRGHGVSITFEFSNPDPRFPLQAIELWSAECAGEQSRLLIRNFATGQEYEVGWSEYRTAQAIRALKEPRCGVRGARKPNEHKKRCFPNRDA